MTGTRKKIRSIFLTAIMVMSVIAMTASFAGTAAAQNTSLSVSDQTITPGNDEDTDGVITVEAAEDSESITSITVWSLTQSNEPNELIAQRNDSFGNTLSGESVSGVFLENQRGEERLGVAIHNTTGPANQSNIAEFETARFTYPDGPHPDVLLDNKSIPGTNLAYQGQILYEEAPGNDYVLRENDTDTQVREVNVDNNSMVKIETENLDTGWYDLVNESGDVEHQFEVIEQTIDAEWDRGNVSVAGDRTQAELAIESNRGGYHLAVTNDQLDAEELADVLDVELNSSEAISIGDGDNLMLLGLGTDETMLADFEGLDSDEYTFSLSVFDTTGFDSATVNAREIEGQLQWSEPFQTQAQGDVAEFTLEMEDTSDAWVLFGSPDVNYMRMLYLQDSDNNGEATFQLNTWEAGNHDPGEAVDQGVFTSEDDEVSDRTDVIEGEFQDLGVNESLDDSIETTDQHPEAVYDVGAALTNSYAVDDSTNELVLSEEQAFHELNLVNGNISGATIHAAPSANADAYDNAQEALEAATETDQIAFRDQYVVEFSASGIFGSIDDEQSLVDSNASLTFLQTNEGPNRTPINISFDQNVEAGAIYADQENGSLVAVVDSRNAEANNVGSQLNVPELQAGQNFVANLNISTGPTTGDASDAFDVVQRTAEFGNLNDAGQFLFSPTENESVEAMTTVAPGTEVRVRARQPANVGDEFSLRFTEAEVTENEDDNASYIGQIDTTLDLSGIAPGAEFETSIRSQSRISDTVQSFIGEIPNATVDMTDVDSDTAVGTVTVDSVQMSRGGFVAIHEGAADGPIIGVSEKLDSGGHTDVRVRLNEDIEESTELYAMPHQDTEDEGNFNFPDADEAYTDAEGSPVTASAQVNVSEQTPTPTPDPTTPTPGGGETPTPGDDDTPTPTPSDDEGPGFGVVVALFALISAGMLAHRRRD